MKAFALKVLHVLRVPIDLVFVLISAPCAFVLLGYRRFGSARLPLTTSILRKIGVFPIRRHYYEPLFDPSLLAKPLSEDRLLPGIDLNENGQLNFLSNLTFSPELHAMDWNGPFTDNQTFRLNNQSFESGDADFLYQFLRAVKPRRVIEIGSGHSTRVARVALLANQAETSHISAHVCIEPYEQSWLEQLGGIQLIRKRLEECQIDWASELQAGDLLFIDSSHMIRPQGDVLKEYLEILPQLVSGVYVHIHDIFTPKDYLQSWIQNNVFFWNEQYLLEALIADRTRYEVIAGLNYLKHHHYDRLKIICPYLSPEREPGSFYIRIR